MSSTIDLDAMRHDALAAVAAANVMDKNDLTPVKDLASSVLALVDEVERLRKDRDDAFMALASIQGVYADDN